MNKKLLKFISLFVIFILSINSAYAETYPCYYIANGNTAEFYYTPGKEVYINKRENDMEKIFNTEPILNIRRDFHDKETGLTVSQIDGSSCPNYIVYRRKANVFLGFDSDGMYGFTNKTEADKFASSSSQINKMTVWTASYKKSNGTQNTQEEYNSAVGEEVPIKNKYITNSFVGNNGSSSGSGYTGSYNSGLDNNQFNDYQNSLSCGEIFGSKSDPNSIAALVDEVLQYPRYIVPVILILMGVLDFSKAVIASKEDEMKKAQTTFIKRCIVAIAVYFVPFFVNVIMSLADIVWSGLGYTSCGL